MWAQLDEGRVIQANSQFWEQMLAMTLERSPLREGFSIEAGHLLGAVSLSGNWKGRIEVRMDGGLAYQATAAMLMQDRETVGEADALDAAKEIANMIAGGIKSSLPRPCAMTVPESAVEPGSFPCEPADADTLLVAFRHATGGMLVRIWEQECNG